MTKKMARRIIELLYSYAWGYTGSWELRQEFHKIKEALDKEFNIGDFLWDGKKFNWDRKKRSRGNK